jgi:hypothetical protein
MAMLEDFQEIQSNCKDTTMAAGNLNLSSCGGLSKIMKAKAKPLTTNGYRWSI